MDSPPSVPCTPMDSPPSAPCTPMDRPPSVPCTPMDSPPSAPCTPMDRPPSAPCTPMDRPLSAPYTPMDTPPAHTHEMNANLDLPAVLNATEDYSPPLSVGRSFYRKRGDLYQKNSGTKRKSHEQNKVKQLLQCRSSNVAGVLQENVSSLKKKLRFSNPKNCPMSTWYYCSG